MGNKIFEEIMVSLSACFILRRNDLVHPQLVLHLGDHSVVYAPMLVTSVDSSSGVDVWYESKPPRILIGPLTSCIVDVVLKMLN